MGWVRVAPRMVCLCSARSLARVDISYRSSQGEAEGSDYYHSLSSTGLLIDSRVCVDGVGLYYQGSYFTIALDLFYSCVGRLGWIRTDDVTVCGHHTSTCAAVNVTYLIFSLLEQLCCDVM